MWYPKQMLRCYQKLNRKQCRRKNNNNRRQIFKLKLSRKDKLTSNKLEPIIIIINQRVHQKIRSERERDLLFIFVFVFFCNLKQNQSMTVKKNFTKIFLTFNNMCSKMKLSMRPCSLNYLFTHILAFD